MQKKKEYDDTHFSSDVLREAYQTFLRCCHLKEQDVTKLLRVQIGNTTWGHDSIEEFFADYRDMSGIAHFLVRSLDPDAEIVHISESSQQTYLC